jgi:hypothetical protein
VNDKSTGVLDGSWGGKAVLTQKDMELHDILDRACGIGENTWLEAKLAFFTAYGEPGSMGIYTHSDGRTVGGYGYATYVCQVEFGTADRAIIDLFESPGMWQVQVTVDWSGMEPLVQQSVIMPKNYVKEVYELVMNVVSASKSSDIKIVR